MHKLEITETTWMTLRAALREFYDAHPELGFRYSEDSYRYFARRFSTELVSRGIARRVHSKAPLLVDSFSFDRVGFELLTAHWTVEKEKHA